MKNKNLTLGNYYKISNADGSESCIVYYYRNPDYCKGGIDGFGYNIADGAGFLPLFDIEEDSVISSIEMKFTTVMASKI